MFLSSYSDQVAERNSIMHLRCLSPDQRVSAKPQTQGVISMKTGRKMEERYQNLYTTMGRQIMPSKSRQISGKKKNFQKNKNRIQSCCNIPFIAPGSQSQSNKCNPYPYSENKAVLRYQTNLCFLSSMKPCWVRSYSKYIQRTCFHRVNK